MTRPPFNPAMLHHCYSPTPSGKGWSKVGECSDLQDAISALSNVTGGQVWQQVMSSVTVSGVTTSKLTWTKVYG